MKTLIVYMSENEKSENEKSENEKSENEKSEISITIKLIEGHKTDEGKAKRIVVKEMRQKGLTYKEIGILVGISRQRAYQLSKS